MRPSPGTRWGVAGRAPADDAQWAIIAEVMINSRPLGAMAPMSDAAIGELNRAFGLE
jgi:hypothetical protein